ncbi:efflux RND transporter permease subunit [Halomonas salinarum]|uniref:efflux RND transporter permease subunit n=1 Tax=Halomonas salinarum TaxID=1158993 RepID=UPI001FD862AF|nr:efflux RND transporter permease subunit [Halomonas salinarum]
MALGLLATRANFGFMVLLGIYSLAGIIINNAIVLIDRIDIERADPALSGRDAVIKASARRLRPILMSAITTILGFLPLILGRDPLLRRLGMAAFDEATLVEIEAVVEAHLRRYAAPEE